MNDRKQKHMERNFPYRCRGDFVLVRVVDLGECDGIALPDQAAEGKEFHVVSVGPEVKDLEPNDRVLMIGSKNTHYYEVPGQRGLIIIREEHCVLVDRPYSEHALEASE